MRLLKRLINTFKKDVKRPRPDEHYPDIQRNLESGMDPWHATPKKNNPKDPEIELRRKKTDELFLKAGRMIANNPPETK